MTTFEGNLQLNGSEKVAIIASRFNHLIVDRLVEGAMDSFKRHGGNVDNLNLILAPGAYELPFVDGEILSAAVPEKFFSENNFYTTAANRMARNIWKNAVTSEEVISCAVMSGGEHK